MFLSKVRLPACALALAATGVLMASAIGFPAPADAGATVGGPPTIMGPRCDDFIGPCGDPLVLGTVPTGFDGPVEVVGMQWTGGSCIYFDNLRHRAGAGYCVESAAVGEKTIEPTMALMPTRSSTEVTGAVDPEAHRVRLSFGDTGDESIASPM